MAADPKGANPPVSGEDVKNVPQEQMAEAVHGADAPPGNARSATNEAARSRVGDPAQIPQEQMAEDAGHLLGDKSG